MRKKTVLIVEDDGTTYEFLRNILESNFHCEITNAENGWQALKLLENKTFDLIISDIAHAGPSGIQLCKEIKRIPKTTSIPCLIVSGIANDKIDKIRSLGVEYLQKPFKTQDFIEIAKKYF